MTCVNCHISCLKCQGSGINQCETCKPDRTLVFDSIQNQYFCTCNQHFFDKSGVCVACYSNCNTCQSEASNGCLSCKNNLIYLSGQCILDCSNVGYFESTEQICQVCHFSCTKCFGPHAYECLECPNDRILSQLSECLCYEGFFSDGKNEPCLPCDKTCLNCSGPSSVECIDCTTQRYFKQETHQCLCAPGTASIFQGNTTLPSSNGLTCSSCSSSCLSCSVPENANYCSTCTTNKYILDIGNGKSLCLCSTGFYSDPLKPDDCLLCHKSCLSCIDNSSYTQCTSCNIIEFRELCLLNSTAVVPYGLCQCLSSYFQASNSEQICQKCLQICRNCATSQDNCIECEGQRILTPTLIDDQNITISSTCVCQQGYFENLVAEFKSSNYCESCHFSCKTCSQGNLATQCDLCGENREFAPDLIDSALEKCVCQPGFFEDIVSNLCNKCHYSCNTCYGSSSDNCIICSKNPLTIQKPSGQRIPIMVIPTKTRCICQNGYYDVNANLLCSKCNMPCLQCSGIASNCSSCSPSQNLVDVITGIQKTCQCPSGFYNVPNSLSCAKCYQNCFECANDLINGCTACMFPRILTNSQTCQCHNLYVEINGVCILPDCPSNNWRGSDLICYQCHNSCLSCSGPLKTDCQNCDITQSELVFGTCQCLRGFYYSQFDGLCNPCNGQCKGCKGPTDKDCNQCNFQRTLNLGVCQCYQGFYSDKKDFKCKICNQNCQSCFGDLEFNCLSCFESRVVDDDGRCVCEPGTYQNISGQCMSCSSICKQCQGPTENECTKCDISRQVSTGQIGFCSCNNGYYSTQDGNCPQCNFQCQQCNGGTERDCTQCEIPRVFQDRSCPCREGMEESFGGCECKEGTFLESIGVCVKCDESCQSCTNSEYCEICKKGWFMPEPLKLCEKCHFSCGACSLSALACTECASDFRIQSPKSDAYPCPCKQNYWEKANKCVQCTHPCRTCSDQSTCLACFEDDNRLLIDAQCICKPNYKEQINELSLTYCFYDPEPEPTQETKQALQGTSDAVSYTVFMTAIPTAVLANPMIIVQLLDVLNEIRFILYINVRFPKVVINFFQTFQAYSFKFLPSVIPDNYHQMMAPESFQSQGNDALFLRNASPNFFIFFCLLMTYIFFKVNYQTWAQKIKTGEKSNIYAFFNRGVQMFQYSMFLGSLEAAYMDLSTFTFLQLNNSACVTLFMGFSYLISIVCLFVLIWFPFFIFQISKMVVEKQHQGDKLQETILQRQFGIVYNFFNQGDLLKVGFYIIILARQAVMAFILVFLFEYPTLTNTLLIVLNGIVVIVIKQKEPYKEQLFIFRDMSSEILFILIYLIVYPLLDYENLSLDTINLIGWTIIGLSIAILLIQMGIVFIQQYEIVKEICHQVQAYFRKNSSKVYPIKSSAGVDSDHHEIMQTETARE